MLTSNRQKKFAPSMNICFVNPYKVLPNMQLIPVYLSATICPLESTTVTTAGLSMK